MLCTRFILKTVLFEHFLFAHARDNLCVPGGRRQHKILQVCMRYRHKGWRIRLDR